jgi:hypothetical protein
VHFLKAKDADHFFKYLLPICLSFEKRLFNSFAHLLIRLFVLLMFTFLSSLYSGYLSPFRWIAGKYFLPFCRLPLHSSNYSIALQKPFNLMSSHLLFLALISWAMEACSKSLSMPISYSVVSCFFLAVIVSCFQVPRDAQPHAIGSLSR